MVSSMQTAAVVVILAALAYILYLWSKRRNQIRCPSCGAWVDITADRCPSCGHTKGATGLDEADAERVEEFMDAGRDYDDLVSGTIPEVKDAVEEDGLDIGKVLAAEKRNKDRVTLVDWLESRQD